MANAANRVKTLFITLSPVMTLAQLKRASRTLKSSEISMALNYLMRIGWLSRKLVPNTEPTNRKEVWEYTYHPQRLTKDNT